MGRWGQVGLFVARRLSPSVGDRPRAHRHTMKTTIAVLCLLTVTLAPQAPEGADARAARPHNAAIVVDTHIDTTQMLGRPGWDFMTRHAPRTGGAGRGAEPDTSHVDLPRMREGGLDAAFFSIYMPGTVTGPEAVKRALVMI